MKDTILIERLKTKAGNFKRKILSAKQVPSDTSYSVFKGEHRVQVYSEQGELIEVSLSSELIKRLYKNIP